MTRKLTDDDRRAVDLLLDHGAGNSTVTRVASAVPQKRLKAAERVLSLLGEMPAQEPPVDLVAKTMQRIDTATIGRVPQATRRATVISPPVA